MNKAFNEGVTLLVKEIVKLKAERDEAVAYLEELCDAFGNMTCGCECCPLNDSENCDEDGNALCKVWNSVEKKHE